MRRNIDLLRLEMATLWEQDRYERLRPHPIVTIAVADDGVEVRLDPALPCDLRRDLEEVPFGDGLHPSVVDECRRLIEPYFASESRLGPSYVFPERVEEVGGTDLVILTSTEMASPELVAKRPDPWWDPDEWEDLLSGRLGPWAIGLAGDRIASICHTPVGSSVAAEAGIWTHPEARGRGYAATVTAAWARVARTEFETLFYSTSSDNTASQAVARKLGLVPIGQIWQIGK